VLLEKPTSAGPARFPAHLRCAGCHAQDLWTHRAKDNAGDPDAA